MKATVLTPFAAMCPAMASAIRLSFCGVLNTQARWASMGWISRALAAIEIMGVRFSAATSIMASEAGVVVEPTSTSTAPSSVSLRALATARVVSEASSSTV